MARRRRQQGGLRGRLRPHRRHALLHRLHRLRPRALVRPRRDRAQEQRRQLGAVRRRRRGQSRRELPCTHMQYEPCTLAWAWRETARVASRVLAEPTAVCWCVCACVLAAKRRLVHARRERPFLQPKRAAGRRRVHADGVPKRVRGSTAESRRDGGSRWQDGACAVACGLACPFVRAMEGRANSPNDA